MVGKGPQELGHQLLSLIILPRPSQSTDPVEIRRTLQCLRAARAA